MRSRLLHIFLRALCPLAVIAAATLPAGAQVDLRPTLLIIPEKHPVAELTMVNRSNEQREVTVNPLFGYSHSGPDGHIHMNYTDTSAAQNHSLAPHLRIFPGQFILQGGGRQVVRLEVHPAADTIPGRELTDGMLWTRLHIASRDVNPDVGAPPDSAQQIIGYRFNQSIGVFYPHGSATTGLDLRGVETRHRDDTLAVIADLARTGNSPYLGHQQLRLLDPQTGDTLRTHEQLVTVYFVDRVHARLDTKGLPPGTYRLELRYENRRRDVPAHRMVRAPAIIETRYIQW